MKSKIEIEIETSKVPDVWSEDVLYNDEGVKPTKKNSMRGDLEEDIHFGVSRIIAKALDKGEIEERLTNDGEGPSDLWLNCEDMEELEDYGNLKVTMKCEGRKKQVLLDVKAKKRGETPKTES